MRCEGKGKGKGKGKGRGKEGERIKRTEASRFGPGGDSCLERIRIEFGGLSGACRRRQRVVDDDD